MTGNIRVVALAIILRPSDGALLAQCIPEQGRVPFYRPCGGGVEFGEHSIDAVRREIMEELGLPVIPERLLGVVENHFVFQDRRGHEIMFCWLCHFEDASAYDRDVFVVNEGENLLFEAHWVHPAELARQGTALYPVEVVGLLEHAR